MGDTQLLTGGVIFRLNKSKIWSIQKKAVPLQRNSE